MSWLLLKAKGNNPQNTVMNLIRFFVAKPLSLQYSWSWTWAKLPAQEKDCEGKLRVF